MASYTEQKRQKTSNVRLGIFFMILTTFTFAVQDSFSRLLASEYNVILIVAIRYFVFAIFIVVASFREPQKFKRALKTKHPLLQISRGILLVAEVCIMVFSFTILGLAKSHAFFSCYPLMVCLLSIPILNEKIGFFRAIIVLFGLFGTLIILRPGTADFSVEYLIPLTSALLFAIYSILTRYVSEEDNAETSLFWVGIVGALFMLLLVPFHWEPIIGLDLLWTLILCFIAILGHFFLIKTLEVCEASKVQPFAFFQIIFASFFGVLLFSETLDLFSIIGTLLIIVSGILMYRYESKE